jgi:hypothetical protein
MVSTSGRAEAGSGFGEGVDGLHDSGVGGVVEGVDPVADLVHDVDLPVRRGHERSIAIAIQAEGLGRFSLVAPIVRR